LSFHICISVVSQMPMAAVEPSLDRGGHPTNIVLLGPPAAGKGTQAEFLVAQYGMVHISTGDLLRARSKFMPELAQYMDNGKLVPDDVVSAVLKERLADADCSARGVLLDGFPRTRAQAESLKAAGVVVSDVVHLNVADHIVTERISGRRIDPLNGKVYHTVHNPPPASVQDRVIQRADDTVEKALVRLAAYHETKEAIIEFYGNLVKTVHVGGNAPNAFPTETKPLLVFDRVRQALEGDTYWGSVVRSELSAKDFDCGSHATCLQAVARYFEHSRYRMLFHGCLSGASASASRVAVRAQVVQVAMRLKPLQQYKMRTWLEHVGNRNVLLGHAISQQLADGSVEDVARGHSALVFLGSTGQALEIPGASQLRDLVNPTLALKGHTPVNVIAAESPEVLENKISPRPGNCWSCAFYVASDEMNPSGYVREAACISYFERLRVHAAAEGGYSGGAHQRLALTGDTLRTLVSYVGNATQGDRLKGYTWMFRPADSTEGVIHLAFEIVGADERVQIKGSLMVGLGARIGLEARL